MQHVGNDFLQFLKAYCQEDLAKLSDNSNMSLVYTIFIKHQNKFEIWQKIPTSIRNKYSDKVPDEILEASKNSVLSIENIDNIDNIKTDIDSLVDKYGYNPELCVFMDSFMTGQKNQPEFVKKVKSIENKGYTQKQAESLAVSGLERKALKEAKQKGLISEEEHRKHHFETRENDIKNIKDNYENDCPEKALTRILKKMANDEDMSRLCSIMFFADKVKQMGREDDLIKYLQMPQSGYYKLSQETKKQFAECMEKFGINIPKNIEQSNEQVTEKDFSHDAAEALKSNACARMMVDKNLQEGKINKEEAEKQIKMLKEIDKHIIIQDWRDKYPERLMVHMIVGNWPSLDDDPPSRRTEKIHMSYGVNMETDKDSKHLISEDYTKETNITTNDEINLKGLKQAFERQDKMQKDLSQYARKIKDKNRENELVSYLETPQARYDNWSLGSKMIFESLCEKNDIGLRDFKTKLDKDIASSISQTQQRVKDSVLQTHKKMNKNHFQATQNGISDETNSKVSADIRMTQSINGRTI